MCVLFGGTANTYLYMKTVGVYEISRWKILLSWMGQNHSEVNLGVSWCKLVNTATLVARKMHAKYFVLENRLSVRYSGCQKCKHFIKSDYDIQQSERFLSSTIFIYYLLKHLIRWLSMSEESFASIMR